MTIRIQEFLRQRLDAGGFSTEDTLASFLPLVREALEAHAAGCVAPLPGVDHLHEEGVRLWFEGRQDACPTFLQTPPQISRYPAAKRAE